MTLEKLDWHLENWACMMKSSHGLRLGYPAKSLALSGGGGSSDDEFEIMCEAVDLDIAHKIDGIIDSISRPQRTAINHVWLKTPHHYPTQALDYEEGIEAILKIAKKRGMQ